MYKFIHSDEDNNLLVSVTIDDTCASHVTLTEAYIQFLRGCGFMVPMITAPDITELANEDNSAD